jgi:hypothetical protein
MVEAKMDTTEVKNRVGRNPLIASDRVQGATVKRPDGEKIGRIERLMLDKISGKVAYVVMSFGGLLGVGERYYTLPWTKLDYDEKLNAYMLDVTKAQLQSAPVLNSEGESAPDRGTERALHEHYDTDPYWRL